MKPLSIQKIAARIGAEYRGGDAMVGGVSTDSRSTAPGCLFVALTGDRFDGNDYVAGALEGGARWAVAQRVPEGCDPERVLLVPDGREALLGIAQLYRESLEVQVIGITGSVGKTTTKEMTACVMEAGFSTWKTPLNLNNEIGVSQTILQLEESHRAAVLEMGMDGPGQMAPLSRCARPDAAIITNIGVSHLQQMGSREGILREKLDITAGMHERAPLLLNADDELLSTVQLRRPVLRYGIDAADAAVRALHIKEFSTHTTFEILYNESRFDAQIPCMGRHNVYNALAAFLAGATFGIEPAAAISALKSYVPAGMRQRVVPHGEFTVVEDCYNAAPDSMAAALRTLGGLTCGGRRIAVLSDMLELGEIGREAHYEAGATAADCGVDALLCTGPLSAEIRRGAAEAGMEQAQYFESKEALFGRLKELIGPGDVVWFKASRGMKLEQVIELVYQQL